MRRGHGGLIAGGAVIGHKIGHRVEKRGSGTESDARIILEKRKADSLSLARTVMLRGRGAPTEHARPFFETLFEPRASLVFR